MDVPQYLSSLQHSRKSQVEAIRLAILGADAGLSESIKWNAPNFVFEGEDRVTFRLQPGDRVDLVLHRGARKRADSDQFAFADTSGLVRWAAPDRGVISIPPDADLDRLLPAILPVIHAWVRT
jgi:hypothetical protein